MSTATVEVASAASASGPAHRRQSSSGLDADRGYRRTSGPSDRFKLGRRARNAVLTVHIVVAVGLLCDSAGFVAVALRHATSDDPSFREHTREILAMFALTFGIPLSFLTLITGLVLGIGTRWGVLRYPWVTIKVALTLTVIAVGAIVLRPLLFDDATVEDGALVLGASWDVVALTVATALSVFKPGRALGSKPAASPVAGTSP